MGREVKRVPDNFHKSWPMEMTIKEMGVKEVPEGNWWQVWETVTDGSPITPAFESAEKLVDYLVEYGDLWDQKRGDGGWKREHATAFVKAGHACSFSIIDGQFKTPRNGGGI